MTTSIKEILRKQKTLCNLTLNKVRTYFTDDTVLSVKSIIDFFIRREWYFLLESIVNNDPNSDCYMSEILEIQRVWILQMIEKQSYPTLFSNEGSRWGLVQKLNITEERLNKSMKSFKLSKNEKDISTTTDYNKDDDESVTGSTEEIWGNLFQHHELPRQFEEYVGKIGRLFVFDGCSDMTIDDDKLRHSSRGFCSAGLQMSGFRGSRIGPVMNGIASVQTNGHRSFNPFQPTR